MKVIKQFFLRAAASENQGRWAEFCRPTMHLGRLLSWFCTTSLDIQWTSCGRGEEGHPSPAHAVRNHMSRCSPRKLISTDETVKDRFPQQLKIMERRLRTISQRYKLEASVSMGCFYYFSNATVRDSLRKVTVVTCRTRDDCSQHRAHRGTGGVGRR